MPHAPTTQDARSNFAVEPAANSGSFKLKKATVKIVGVAFGVPSRATPAAASSSPVPGPVKAKAKEVERYASCIPSRFAILTANPAMRLQNLFPQLQHPRL
jgi:hypothetical protein